MELYYQIALKSVPFDNSYKNVLRFDTRSEQEAYFKTNTLFSNSPNVNFNVGSLYATNVIYDGTEENINELLNHNYCIIKDNRPNAQLKFYYYFVTNAMQDCDNRIKLSLELDIFQTYYIDLKFGDSIIYKAHLNRFVENGDGTVSFDGSPTSKLFEREDIKNVAKRMTKRTNVSLYPNTTIGNWLNEHVLCWAYIYIDNTRSYTFRNLQNEAGTTSRKIPNVKFLTKTKSNQTGNTSAIPSNISILCFPILDNASAIQLKVDGNEKDFYWGNFQFWLNDTKNVLDEFAENNNGYSGVYSIKMSAYPPTLQYDVEYEIEDASSLTTLIIKNCTITNEAIYNPLIPKVLDPLTEENINTVCNDYRKYSIIIDGYLCFGIIYAIDNGIISEYNVDKLITFEKNEIITADKNTKFNPKLLSSDYFDLRISDQTENGFDYDLLKLNKTNLKIKYTESLTPDTNKIYARITDIDGVYINDTDKNLTGFVSTNENSIIMPTTQFQQMLANNKNYFLQNSINREFGVIKGAIGTVGGVIGGNIAGTIQGTLNTGLNYAQDKINENLTVDNLKNAPASIVGAKGNIIFETGISNIGLIVEEWDILENEKEMINDYMCLYGFTYNRVDNIKNVDNIRKFYNFVRADIETINGANISETVHQKFRQCFLQGVRFWNTDTFSYKKENYERWLENE